MQTGVLGLAMGLFVLAVLFAYWWGVGAAMVDLFPRIPAQARRLRRNRLIVVVAGACFVVSQIVAILIGE